jgi:rhodanese-related sulfurtransferase
MAITKEELKNKMREKGLVVLNVEPESDFLKRHIEGSHNITWGQDHGAFAQAAEKAYGKQRAFVLYGSDVTSAAGSNAAKYLQGLGFNAMDFPGGMKDWLEGGFPIQGTQTLPKNGPS